MNFSDAVSVGLNFKGYQMLNIIGVKSISLGVMLVVVGATVAAGTIVGSKHDFTAASYGTGGQICVACHTPHGGNTSVTDAPLWNHTLSATAAYTMYSSTTMNATAPSQPAGNSKLCLSCHDGTVAINSFGGGVNGAAAFVSAASNLGTTLANDHPVGITYDAALVAADGALNAITTPVTIGAAGKQSTGTISTKMLYSGKIECASCHDVHNTFSADATGLVKVTMTSSALCTTCHNK